MRAYSIPDIYIPGFNNIIKFSTGELKSFAEVIRSLKVGEDLESILNKSKGFLPSFSDEDVYNIIRSLVSVVDIFESSGRNIPVFTDRFSESYLSSNPSATNEDSIALKRNLSILLEAFDSIRITSKAQNIILENKNNFKEARVVTDIRLVFDENLEDNKKFAVIIHNLKIDFARISKSDEFFVAMDLSDLKKMKVVIDRAIEKDRIIRESKFDLNFIDL